MHPVVRFSALFFIGLCVFLSGCQTKLYEHTDPDYSISITYPGNVDLYQDKQSLQRQTEYASPSEKSVDQPEPLFVITTPERSLITCAVHKLPAGHSLTAEEYYQVSTAAELTRLKANIVEAKTDVLIHGKSFQRVGFTLRTGEQVVRSCIYQHLDTKTGQVLVLTATSYATEWEQEYPGLESMIQSVKLAW